MLISYSMINVSSIKKGLFKLVVTQNLKKGIAVYV